MSESNEIADAEYAKNVARMLLSSYPNQAHDPKTFGVQVTTLFTGLPKSLLRQMVDPRDGFLASNEFLSIAALNKWIDKRVPRFQPPPEHRLMIEPPDPYIPPEERAANAARLRVLAEEIRERARAEHRKRYGIKDVPAGAGPVHVGDHLLKALENLMAMNGVDRKTIEALDSITGESDATNDH